MGSNYWQGNIGDVYERDGIKSTIIGSVKVKRRLYIVHCEVCSKDKELWPEGSITTYLSDLKRGMRSCACSKGCRWTEHQNKIRVKRLCTSMGYIFHGWFGDYKKDTTYLDLENPVTSNRWHTTTINNLLHGFGDPVAGRIETTKASYKEDSYHIQQFLDTGVYPEGTKFSRITSLRWSYTCGNCNNTFEGDSGHLKLGKMSCTCNGRFGGFNKNKPAYFYVVRWESSFKSYLKFGVTTNTVEFRVGSQKRHSPLIPTILYKFYNKDGGKVLECERSVKTSLKTNVCSKELLPDGFTETTEDSEENLKTIVDYACNRLGTPCFDYTLP